VKTVVVMVEPAALAYTFTPPIFTPSAEAIVPLRLKSGARAAGETSVSAARAAALANRLGFFLILFLLVSVPSADRL
jgi:hypothetical protein